ncbi:MAG TPA: DinB family protein [Acidimicrobiia bacterium]|nr:DinB family protein [Acidimicrobiia bacterium]
MTDQGPPKQHGDERAALTAMLGYLRGAVLRKLDGLTDDVARAPRVASGTNLLWLVKHLTMAETFWFQGAFAGLTRPLPSNELDDTDTVADVVATYRATCAESDRIIAGASLDDLCARAGRDGVVVDLRWVLVHMIEETARHAGHADILRELADGSTGR